MVPRPTRQRTRRNRASATIGKGPPAIGIVAVPGDVDGGGNRAEHNVGAQCAGPDRPQ